jgi:hypothetical protein
MKQTAGVITALAVVLAIFGVSSLPKSPTGGAGSTQTEDATKASKGDPVQNRRDPTAPAYAFKSGCNPS